MSLKKKASKSIAIALVGVSMITPILNTVNANEISETSNNIPVDLVKEYDKESRLGGGPSPSAGWTYKTTVTKTFTNSQLRTLDKKLQAAVRAGKKSQTAFNVANYMVGLMGWPGASMSGYLTFCGQSVPSVIKDSANTVSRALVRGGSVKLRVKKYVRPASGQVLCVYSGIA